jgi:hypothetical protein
MQVAWPKGESLDHRSGWIQNRRGHSAIPPTAPIVKEGKNLSGPLLIFPGLVIAHDSKSKEVIGANRSSGVPKSMI